MDKTSLRSFNDPPELYHQSFDLLRSEDILNESRSESHKAAHKLLIYLSNYKTKTNITHKIATAESLTAGLMFSTLVDIPMFGDHKYGSFSVYNTDAKRVFLGVRVENVYTRRCAKEMAEGILKNSNATIGISVTGNAMPYYESKEMLGEVFIGVATYSNDNTIICETYPINMCRLNGKNKQCTLWYNTLVDKIELQKEFQDSSPKLRKYGQFTDGYNASILTSYVSNFIRVKTTQIAFEKALTFLKKTISKNKSSSNVPTWLINSYIDKDNYVEHDFRGDNCQNNTLKEYRKDLIVKCLDTECLNTSRNGDNNALFYNGRGGALKANKKNKKDYKIKKKK